MKTETNIYRRGLAAFFTATAFVFSTSWSALADDENKEENPPAVENANDVGVAVQPDEDIVKELDAQMQAYAEKILRANLDTKGFIGKDDKEFAEALREYFKNHLPEAKRYGFEWVIPESEVDLSGWLVGPDGKAEKIDLGEKGNDFLRILPEPASPFFIGVVVEELPEILRDHLELNDKGGVLVKQVMAGSPAARSGIKVHDVISKAGGIKIDSQKDLVAAINASGQKEVAIEVVSRGQSRTVKLKPARREAPKITSKPFVPNFRADDIQRWINPGQGVSRAEIDGLRNEIRANREILEKILDRLEKIEVQDSE